MGYLDEAGLSRYNDLIRSWVLNFAGTVQGVTTTLNWQKTDTATTVTCYPIPASPLKPSVNFVFTENPPEDGEPKTPINPSTIAGVSSITVTRCETAGVDETAYAVSLGDTYYGGTVDVSTGVMTVTWTGFLATNTYGTSEKTTTIAASVHLGSQAVTSISGIVCNRFISLQGTDDVEHIRFKSGFTNSEIFINKNRLNYNGNWAQAVDDWFSANPTIVVFQLATPSTVQLSPVQIYSLSQVDEYTPRLNTVYSDQQSVQVGYAKSPIQTELELTNAIISLGGNV